MKGIIRENLGASRYIVGVTPNAEPVSEIKAKLDAEYDDASQKLIQAQGDLQEVQDSYNALLAVIVELTANYQTCINEFNLGQCIDQKTAICAADYSACEDACYEIESGEGECDFECWTQRDACLALCRNQRTACEAEAVIACQEAQQAHVTACQEQWAPQIAALQTQALAAMEPIQAALKQIQDLEAQKLSLARRIYELETVAAKEEAITCWRAQFDDTLTAGAEVEVARTPGGRNVITEIVSPDACWQDARGLPGTHLFVNAAIAPGFETWRPTWRTGTVKALLPAEDKLEVEIKSGTMTGSLGTLYSRTPLDCTPPQSYFDGNWQAAESRIAAARDALKAAQESLAAAAQARDDCIGQYDQTWSNACYTDKTAICDQVWAEWLANCEAVGEDPAICQEQYQASLAACYAQSLADCADERDALIAQCRADFQPAVDAAQAAVEDAAESLNLELAGRYQPASPLILKLPVEHCNLERYAVDDDVLIDFPTRSGSEANPMAVWQSGRVIGWASETKRCQSYVIEYNTVTFTYSGDPIQIVYEGDDGTPITIYNVRGGYYGSYDAYEQHVSGSAGADVVFVGWSDGRTDNPRTDTNVRDYIYVGAVGVGWPDEIFIQIIVEQNHETGDFTRVSVTSVSLQFYSEEGITDWFGLTYHWFPIPWPEDTLYSEGWTGNLPVRYIGEVSELPGILPDSITLETIHLHYYGLSEQSKTYQRGSPVTDRLYRYTRQS